MGSRQSIIMKYADTHVGSRFVANITQLRCVISEWNGLDKPVHLDFYGVQAYLNYVILLNFKIFEV